MNRSRVFQVAGLMPALSMIILMGVEFFFAGREGAASPYVYGAAQLAAFVLPYLFIRLCGLIEKTPFPGRLGKFSRKAVPFVVFMSILTAIACFLLNCLVALLTNDSIYEASHYAGAALQGSGWAIFLVMALLPAVCEELLFRSGVLGAMEQGGTYVALLISALTFALVHGSPSNLIGPLFAGLVYGYMSYILGSIWPAVFAHLLNNLYTMGIGYLSEAYQSLGFWPYILLIHVFLFFLFLYLSMRSLEKILERGKAPRVKAVGLYKASSFLLFTPGLWVLAILFIFKILY